MNITKNYKFNYSLKPIVIMIVGGLFLMDEKKKKEKCFL